MTQELIERFRPILEPLEKERLKALYNRKGFLFIILLLDVLGVFLFFAGIFGESKSVLCFGLFMFAVSALLLFARAQIGQDLRARLRSALVRDWFHASYPGVFLGAPPREIPIEVSRSLREACVRATAQNLTRTFIEERVFFDTDTYHSWAFILRERSIWGGIQSRALVWFRAASFDQALVAYAWPPLGLGRTPDVRFFNQGQPVAPFEPLSSKLVHVYEKLRSRSSGRAVRVSISPSGVWAGVRLQGPLFEPPPLSKTFLSADSFATWAQDAELPVSREIAPLLASL